MTYDERREIEEYTDIIGKNIKRLERSIEMLREAIDKMTRTARSNEEEKAE